jgi:hypothetical protein
MREPTFVSADLRCDALGADVRLLALEGRESMNALSAWEVEVVAISGAVAQ